MALRSIRFRDGCLNIITNFNAFYIYVYSFYDKNVLSRRMSWHNMENPYKIKYNGPQNG